MATSPIELQRRKSSAATIARSYFKKEDNVLIDEFIHTRDQYRLVYPQATDEISQHELIVLTRLLGKDNLSIGLRYASLAEKILTSGSDGAEI